MKKTSNPIKRIREEIGLSLNDLSIVTGVASRTIYWNEIGMNMKVTRKLLDFFEERGYDRNEIIREYGRCREEMKKEVMKTM